MRDFTPDLRNSPTCRFNIKDQPKCKQDVTMNATSSNSRTILTVGDSSNHHGVTMATRLIQSYVESFCAHNLNVVINCSIGLYEIDMILN